MTVVVKLGGSILTDKSRYRTLRADVLARLAGELAEARFSGAVVHGAGSFGHVLAREHRLSEGGGREKAAPFARVHADVRALDLAVLEALIAAGLAPVAIPPFALPDDEAARVRPFVEAVARGLVPVTHGDAVLDPARGFGIVSGDALLAPLARALKVERVVVATDVDGLFDRDPKLGGARLLERVRSTDLGVAEAGASRAPDVTGGMGGKVKALAGVAAAATPVTLVNGLEPGRLKDAVLGRAVKGTIIHG
ncbi:MAG TPA: isopentenyl phosphate kinase [Candidatus Thermoplasmatota archaeon]|nr:isopentenyl phosphate kinase [Candidatus Thermoplasmatota archaeon]